MFQLSAKHLAPVVRVELKKAWRDDAGIEIGRFAVAVHSFIAYSCQFEIEIPISAAARFADRALDWLASTVPPDRDHPDQDPDPDDEGRVVAELAPGQSQPQLRLHPYYGITAVVGNATLVVSEILEPERERSIEMLQAFRHFLDRIDVQIDPEPPFTPLRLRSGDGGDEVCIALRAMPSRRDSELPCIITARTSTGISGSFWPAASGDGVLRYFVRPLLEVLDNPDRPTKDAEPYWHPFGYSDSTSLLLRVEADEWTVVLSPGLNQGREELELKLLEPHVEVFREGLLIWRDALAKRF